MCSTLTHASEAWTLTEPVMRSVNGFNSRCLHIITGQDYGVTATAQEYDLLRAIRQRRLRYLYHILRMPESRVVRRALVALAKGGTVYHNGSLFMDCQAMARCVECTGQTTMLRRTATVPLDPLGLRWNSYIQFRHHHCFVAQAFRSHRIAVMRRRGQSSFRWSRRRRSPVRGVLLWVVYRQTFSSGVAVTLNQRL